jgi:endonuclease YncB( thermonuclease family)
VASSIYDGDTFRGTIKGWPPIIGEHIGIRIFGIDCPELKDKKPEIKEKARQAKQFTVDHLRKAKVIELKNLRRDKYFRILADVYVDGKNLGHELIKQGHAKTYDGGTKEQW